jgi:hypothetical protein
MPRAYKRVVATAVENYEHIVIALWIPATAVFFHLNLPTVGCERIVKPYERRNVEINRLGVQNGKRLIEAWLACRMRAASGRSLIG